MTLILMVTGAGAWFAARLAWTVAGVAHRRTEAAAGRRGEPRGAGR